MENIYKVYNGELVTIPVLKVTKLYVYVDRPRELGYVQRIEKSRIYATPVEAVSEELKIANCSVDIGIKTLKSAELRLLRAKALWVEHEFANVAERRKANGDT